MKTRYTHSMLAAFLVTHVIRGGSGSDFSGLTKDLADLATQVTATTTTEEGAEAVISAQGEATAKAVADALAADDAADAGSIAAAQAAVKTVTQQFADSAAKLGAAIVAGTPVVPTQTPAAV